VYAATSAYPNFIDSAMRRPGRLDAEIEISVPTATDRYEILTDILAARGVGVCGDVAADTGLSHEVTVAADTRNCSSVCSNICSTHVVDTRVVVSVASHAHGMVGSDLVRVVKEACVIHVDKMLVESINQQQQRSETPSNGRLGFQNFKVLLDKDSSFSDCCRVNAIVLSKSDLMSALRTVNPSALREVAVEVPSVKWKDIGGMDTVKQSLKEVSGQNSADLFR
jgi:transitional endoplasmic reticulum ATPase